MFAANREPGTRRREWRRVRGTDETEGKGEINPCPGTTSLAGSRTGTPPFPPPRHVLRKRRYSNQHQSRGNKTLNPISPINPTRAKPSLDSVYNRYKSMPARNPNPFYSQYAASVRLLNKVTNAPEPTRGFLVLFVSLVILLVLAVFLCVLDTPYAAKVSRCNRSMVSQTHLVQSTAPSGDWYLFPTCRLLLHDAPLTQPE